MNAARSLRRLVSIGGPALAALTSAFKEQAPLRSSNSESLRLISTTAQRSERSQERFLVTGALGQIGLELVPFLRSKYCAEAVVASDVRLPQNELLGDGPFFQADVREAEQIAQIIHEERVDTVINLASILSAAGEQSPQLALDVNISSTQNILELSRQFKLKTFIPSTIAVFGPSSEKRMTPDKSILDPITIYGITKVHLELLGQYYRQTHGVDFRCLRYPGIVSSKSQPGGGTIDYAVDIFHAAVLTGKYTCYLSPHQRLPMMYMPDCIKATAQLLLADPRHLTQSVYNVTAMSFTPAELAHSIREHIPDFTISYEPDFRQGIATSWPHSIDDRFARRDWGWHHDYYLQAMTADMLHAISSQQSAYHLPIEAAA